MKSKVEAQASLAPEEIAEFADWVTKAIAEYFTQYESSARLLHSPRSRASLIYDHIIGKAARGLEEIRGARILTKRNLILLAVRDEFLIRFKKLDADRRPRGIRTRQLHSFMQQIPDFEMPSEATHLILGYQLNPTATDVQSIFLICPSGERNAWEWSLSGQSIMELGANDVAQVEPVRVRRARLKTKQTKKVDNDVPNQRSS